MELQEILQQTANYYQQLPIKIKGKPCLILGDTEVTLSTLNPNHMPTNLSKWEKKANDSLYQPLQHIDLTV